MSHIYRELKAIPIPEFALVNRNDDRVYTLHRGPNGERKRRVIGRASGSTHMYPNATFKFEFPELWRQYYGDQDDAQSILQTGLYAATLAIAQRTGLYQDLLNAYGALYGNGVLDYAMYTLAEGGASSSNFEASMAIRMLFSGTRPSDEWFSRLFSRFMTPEAEKKFRIYHIERSIERGVKRVWLCIDGFQCRENFAEHFIERDSEKVLNQQGNVSYLWAVNSIDGTPITWSIQEGKDLNPTVIREMVECLISYGISVEGMIVSTRFCSPAFLDVLEKLHLRYVVMLQNQHHGFREMVDTHQTEVRWRAENFFNDEAIFGLTDQYPIFDQSGKPSCIGLYFDISKEAIASLRLITQIRQEILRINESITHGRPVEVAEPLREYLEIKKGDSRSSVTCHMELWQDKLKTQGFFAIASSDHTNAEEIYDIYKLREVSSRQFERCQLRCLTASRASTIASIRNQFLVGFVTSNIRIEMLRACRLHGRNLRQVINQFDQYIVRRMPDGTYNFIDNLTHEDKLLFAEWGLCAEHFHYLASTQIQNTEACQNSSVCQLPDILPSKSIRRRVAKQDQELIVPRRSPGRPKGSKNKKTLEKEVLIQQRRFQSELVNSYEFLD